MYDMNLLKHITGKLQDYIPEVDSTPKFKIKGGVCGYHDDTGEFIMQEYNGTMIVDSDIIVYNIADISNEAESIPDSAIVNYQILLDFFIPVQYINDFSQTIYDFRFDNNAKSTLIAASDTEDLNTIFTINFPNKESNIIDGGAGKTYIQFSVEINSLGGDGVNFGNETIFSVGKYYKVDTTEYVQINPAAIEDPIDAVFRNEVFIISEYAHDNDLINTGWSSGTMTIPALTDFTDVLKTDTTVATPIGNVKVKLNYIEEITRLITRDDFQGLSTRTFQTKDETRALTTDSGENWGTSLSMIANFENSFFHRLLMKQIASVEKHIYQLKIELPTFDPYYRKVVLESTAQASPLGGLTSISATIKEV